MYDCRTTATYEYCAILILNCAKPIETMFIFLFESDGTQQSFQFSPKFKHKLTIFDYIIGNFWLNCCEMSDISEYELSKDRYVYVYLFNYLTAFFEISRNQSQC